MTKEDNRKERRSWWMQFLISVVGTAIGVGLTFAVSNRIENRKQAQAQRITAMMVIHDIDETIEKMELLKDNMEEEFNATIYAMSSFDQFDSLSQDTLIMALNYLVADDNEYTFDKSKEKIFHSSPDTWQNLGSMKFIDNVQSFYFNRESFLDMYNKSVYWQHPVQTSELDKIHIIDESLSVQQYQELYYAMLSKFLKEKLTETNVQNYINYAGWRIGIINDMIGAWIRLNNENKFLMSITDEELEAYVNSINKTGVAVKEENLIGRWSITWGDDRNAEYDLRKDHTFMIVANQSVTANMPFASGKIKTTYSIEGTWSLEGDSLIYIIDWGTYMPEIDGSGMKALPGRQDMLDNLLKEYEESLENYKRDNIDRKERDAYGARMDASGDKLEMKQAKAGKNDEMDVEVQYMKRKK